MTDYSISITTLEEVFLSVGTHDEPEGAEVEMGRINPSDSDFAYEPLPEHQEFTIAENRETSWKFCRHASAMIRKRIIYSMRDLKGIIFEIALPILLVLLGLVLLTQISVYEN